MKLRRGLRDGSRDCLVVGPRLVEAGAASLTLHPRSAQQMYTGTADHALTAELVSLVDVPVVASGDIVSRAKAQAVLATTGAAAVMVGRAAQGNPWVLEEIVDGDGREPSREEVVAELVLFVRETVRELGERRASGFLKKFYGWYLGRGRFPRPFKQELVVLDSTEEVERRLIAAAPGALELIERLEAEVPSGDDVTLELPISDLRRGLVRAAAGRGAQARRARRRSSRRRTRCTRRNVRLRAQRRRLQCRRRAPNEVGRERDRDEHAARARPAGRGSSRRGRRTAAGTRGRTAPSSG